MNDKMLLHWVAHFIFVRKVVLRNKIDRRSKWCKKCSQSCRVITIGPIV